MKVTNRNIIAKLGCAEVHRRKRLLRRDWDQPFPVCRKAVSSPAQKKPEAFASGSSKQFRLNDLLAHRLALGEQIQIIGPAGLRVGAGHIESAKRMRAHHGARTLAIDVQVADMELLNGAFDLLPRLGIDGAS